MFDRFISWCKSLKVRYNMNKRGPKKLDLSWVSSKRNGYIKVYINAKWYKLPIILKRGPFCKEITSIRNEKNEDILNELLPFFGPNCDLFGLKTTPHYFGLNRIVVILNNEEYIFSENTIIEFIEENTTQYIMLKIANNIEEKIEENINDPKDTI